MALTPETTSMALFCDFENVALGVRDAKFDRFDIKRVLERLLLKGSIVVKKAYCDWDRYKPFKAAMHEANFELIEIPHVRQSGKNSADIRLVVDALDLCYTKSHVNTFVIISGDSDFSPLVSKLRENAKQVIGVGVKQSTSDLLIANCDEFIFYDDLVREGQRQAAKRGSGNPSEVQPAPPPKQTPEEERNRREASESRKRKAIDMAVETFEALVSERGDAGRIWPSMVKQALKRRKPDFSESYFGFRTFGGLLEEAQGRGLLELGRDEKGNVYVARSSGAPSRHESSMPVSHPAPVHAGPPASEQSNEVSDETFPEGPDESTYRRNEGRNEVRNEGRDEGQAEHAPTETPSPRSRSRGGRKTAGRASGKRPTNGVESSAEAPAADMQRVDPAERASESLSASETADRAADDIAYRKANDMADDRSSRHPDEARTANVAAPAVPVPAPSEQPEQPAKPLRARRPRQPSKKSAK